MHINEEILTELIAVYKTEYNMNITRADAQEIAERIVHLFGGLRRSGIRPPGTDADIRS